MKDVREILSRVKDGELSIEDAVIEMRLEPFEDLGYAQGRSSPRRCARGWPEVIYCAGENPRADPQASRQAMLRPLARRTS